MCVRSRGSVALKGKTAQRFAVDVKVAGQGASTVVQAREALDAKYQPKGGAEVERQIIDRCAAIVGGGTEQGEHKGDGIIQTSSTHDDLMSPPFVGRVYFGPLPYPKNALISWLFLSHSPRTTSVELWVDGSPVDVIINRRKITRLVHSGDHAGQQVPLIPKGTPPYGALQLDSPGPHGIETWCYDEVPGVGLVQVWHGLSRIFPGRNTCIYCD